MIYIIANIISAILSFILYYLILPPINLSSVGFWGFCFLIFTIFLLANSLPTAFEWDEPIILKFGLLLWVFYILVFGTVAFFNSQFFNANAYGNIIENNIQTVDISEFTPTIDNVPLMDRDTAELLASRTMGTLVDEVSQYTLGRSTQINYQGHPIRVVPLEYSGFFKWANNKNVGIPAYITVDMKTSETEIHTLEKGMRYSPSGCFGDDLNRLLRFKYPGKMLGTPVFEIDDSSNPYWVVPIRKHTIGLFGGEDISGILLVDAITGDIEEYDIEDIPNWIDNVYPTDMLIEHYDWYGQYQEGFWNSIIGQKGVVNTTDGYNYIPIHDDIYVYTGVTSVVSDESNIGFILVNKRTKEYEYYEIPGAEEYSAMSSAEGQVQHLGYTSTFPLLLKIEGQPTYCVALKDAGGLVKMYGLVNMSQYQIVVTDENLNTCLKKYRDALKANGQEVVETRRYELSGKIEDIRTANIDGTTYLYIKLENNNTYYSFNVKDNEEIVLMNTGDDITFMIEDETLQSKIIPGLLKN